MKQIIMNLKIALNILTKSKHKEKLNDVDINVIRKITSHKSVGKRGVKLLIFFIILYSFILFAYNFENIIASSMYNIKYYDQLSEVYLQYIELNDMQIKNNSNIYNDEKVKIYTLLYNNNSAIDAIKNSNRHILKCLFDKQYKEIDSDNKQIKNMTNYILENGYKINENSLKECESDINTIFNTNSYYIYTAIEKRNIFGIIILLVFLNNPVVIFVYILLLVIIILKLFNTVSLYRMKKIIIPIFFVIGILYSFNGYILPNIILSTLLKRQAIVMMGTVIIQMISHILIGCICWVIFNKLYKKYCMILNEMD